MATKKQVVDTLATVKNLGPKYAEMAYEQLEVRTIADLKEAAKANKLQTLTGIGAAKEAAILKAAENPVKPKPKRPVGRPPGAKNKGKSKKSGAKKPASAAKSAAKPAEKKSDAKKPAGKKRPVGRPPGSKNKPKTEKASGKKRPVGRPPGSKNKPKTGAAVKTAATPKPAPKPAAKPAAKPTAKPAERPQSTYTRPEPSKQGSTNPVLFIGKLVFKIAKKLLS